MKKSEILAKNLTNLAMLNGELNMDVYVVINKATQSVVLVTINRDEALKHLEGHIISVHQLDGLPEGTGLPYNDRSLIRQQLDEN